MSNSRDRIRERDLKIPALQVLAKHPSKGLSTSELIAQLEARFEPAGEDAEILMNRHDTKFSQIVRNLISHKKVSGNPIADGFIEYLGRRGGLRITQSGLDYVNRLAA
jgi:hypothetical protein